MEDYHLIAFAAKERRLLPHETHDYHVSISLATCCTLYPIAVHGQEESTANFQLMAGQPLKAAIHRSPVICGHAPMSGRRTSLQFLVLGSIPCMISHSS